MLNHTFCHIPSIGTTQETKFWQQGFLNWKDLTSQKLLELSFKNPTSILSFLEQSEKELEHKNPAFFIKNLPTKQHWRIFPHFLAETAYLDIETTGLNRYKEHITCLTLYHQNIIKTFVYQENLQDFPQYFSQFKVVITYNGKAFDLPFLEHFFNQKFPLTHLDLRPFLQVLGYQGGLKSCEKKLGIQRNGLEEIEGKCAIHLWKEYEQTQNPHALETLLAYNIEDTVNLEQIMKIVYNKNLEKTPFLKEKLEEEKKAPKNPYHLHPKTIQKILKDKNKDKS